MHFVEAMKPSFLDMMPSIRFGSKQVTAVLAAVGALSLLSISVCFVKLLIALKKQSDVATAFLPAPPRDAYSGRVFWITGASSGIGREMALHLCSNFDNVKLILSSRRESVLQEVAAECRERGSGNEVKVVALDLAEVSKLPLTTKKALSVFGHVDVLVNNGGVSTRSFARNAGFDVDPYVMNVDFLSYASLTKALLPSFEQQGRAKSDSNFTPTIINISSVAGKFGVPVRTAYCAAKHAVMGWFEAFRIEQVLSGNPVKVLNVVLGSARTNVAQNAIGPSVDKTFGSRGRDANIEAGLEPSFVVDRVLAAAYAGREEIWVAPRKEMLALFLSQYIPEMARVIMMKTAAKQYAIE